MPHMKFILIVASFILVNNSFAQVDTASARSVVMDSNTVLIHKDSRLDLLIKKQAMINEVSTRDARKTDKGFRLMIISTTNREEALADRKSTRLNSSHMSI